MILNIYNPYILQITNRLMINFTLECFAGAWCSPDFLFLSMVHRRLLFCHKNTTIARYFIRILIDANFVIRDKKETRTNIKSHRAIPFDTRPKQTAVKNCTFNITHFIIITRYDYAKLKVPSYRLFGYEIKFGNNIFIFMET